MAAAASPRLLVVEDDVIVARSLERTLGRRGYRVSVARTCREARAASGHFDCAVLDVHLPDGSGIELARELCGTLVGAVVFFSGSSDESTRLEAARLGTFVTKSSGIDLLVSAISDALGDRS